ncbi:MAG: thiamine phosphate synthase [Methyloprofundus sp.]|nr:thiamine phosphate synthase [Methyloprofundus sp.]
MIFPKAGLYAITQTEDKTPIQVLADVNEALKAGIQVLQYRDKNPDDAVYLAGALKELCHLHHIPFIINDDIDLAEEVGADGVHLGQDDSQLSYAREVLGDKAIIGVSCYDSIELALAAEKQSADYVAFGRFFPSSSKPLAAPAQISTLQAAKQQITIPIVAIGGILPDNGEKLLSSGADLLAVIGGLFSESPYESTLAYHGLLK